MAVVHKLMGFASDKPGNNYSKQEPLYLSAVAFSYAVWENFVEDLADELVAALARTLDASKIPAGARSLIEAGATQWDLSVHPGWRGLWVQRVRELTKGSEDVGKWGLNTASKVKVDELFGVLGINPIPERLVAPAFVGSVTSKRKPDKVAIRSGDGTVDVKHVLSVLVDTRGEAVHTATTSDPLYKNQVLWWANFITALYSETDRIAREQCKALVSP